MKTIGQRIVFLREKYNITQKTLAKDINITEASLSRYENDLREPKAEIVKKLAQRLNTSADFLLACSDDATAPTYNNEFLQNISSLSQESKEELTKYIDLLKIKDNISANQNKKSSALQKTNW